MRAGSSNLYLVEDVIRVSELYAVEGKEGEKLRAKAVGFRKKGLPPTPVKIQDGKGKILLEGNMRPVETPVLAMKGL